MFIRALLILALVLSFWPGTAQTEERDPLNVESNSVSDHEPLGTMPAVVDNGSFSLRMTLARGKFGQANSIAAYASQRTSSASQVSSVTRCAGASYGRSDYAIHMALGILLI